MKPLQGSRAIALKINTNSGVVNGLAICMTDWQGAI